MTKEEFENGYCERSQITIEFYNEHLVSLPCSCGVDECEGWSAVSNNELSIKSHNFLYNHEHETYRGRDKAPTE